MEIIILVAIGVAIGWFLSRRKKKRLVIPGRRGKK